MKNKRPLCNGEKFLVPQVHTFVWPFWPPRWTFWEESVSSRATLSWHRGNTRLILQTSCDRKLLLRSALTQMCWRSFKRRYDNNSGSSTQLWHTVWRANLSVAPSSHCVLDSLLKESFLQTPGQRSVLLLEENFILSFNTQRFPTLGPQTGTGPAQKNHWLILLPFY